jgi:hypothetical protein
VVETASMTQVTFNPKRGNSVTVKSGDNSPVLMDGTVVWDAVARPKRTSLTRFSGRLPWKQDISILFDGLIGRESQEGKIHRLERMSTEDTVINLEGHALRTDLDWVFLGIDWDDQDVIWDTVDKDVVRLRQGATVHLMEYVPDDIITTPAQPKVKKRKPKKHIPAAKGMSLKRITIIEYGSPDKWRVIRDANFPILVGATPRTVIPPGIILNIPEPDGAIQYFTVP